MFYAHKDFSKKNGHNFALKRRDFWPWEAFKKIGHNFALKNHDLCMSHVMPISGSGDGKPRIPGFPSRTVCPPYPARVTLGPSGTARGKGYSTVCPGAKIEARAHICGHPGRRRMGVNRRHGRPPLPRVNRSQQRPGRLSRACSRFRPIRISQSRRSVR